MPFLLRWYFKTANLNTKAMFCCTVILITFSSIFVHMIEPKKFRTIFDGLYWTFTTLATVGYGDFFPETIIGKIWAMFLFSVGIGLFTIAISKLFESFRQSKRKMEEGKMDYQGKNQIIVIGWSGKAKVTIKNILKFEPETDVILIDDKLEIIPMESKEHFFFIKGVPSRVKILERANVKMAKMILIFAEEKLKMDSPYDADARTAFIVTSVERIAPNVRTIIEIVLEENKENFSHIDSKVEYKLSDEAFAHVMYPVTN